MADNREKAKETKVILDRWFEPVCERMWNMEPGKEGTFEVDINYDSTPQVLHALKMLGIKVDGETIQNTNKKTQKKIKDLEPIRALTKYRSAQKLAGTNGKLIWMPSIQSRAAFTFASTSMEQTQAALLAAADSTVSTSPGISDIAKPL